MNNDQTTQTPRPLPLPPGQRQPDHPAAQRSHIQASPPPVYNPQWIVPQSLPPPHEQSTFYTNYDYGTQWHGQPQYQQPHYHVPPLMAQAPPQLIAPPNYYPYQLTAGYPQPLLAYYPYPQPQQQQQCLHHTPPPPPQDLRPRFDRPELNRQALHHGPLPPQSSHPPPLPAQNAGEYPSQSQESGHGDGRGTGGESMSGEITDRDWVSGYMDPGSEGNFGGAASIQAGRNTILTSAEPVDHSVGDEGQLGILVPSHAPPTTSEPQIPQSINQDAREKNISIPAQASTTPQPHGEIGNEEVPSITLSQGSSNFQISETNAAVILNGDGQFTKSQKNLISDCIANLLDINNNLKEHVLTQSTLTLPRAKAEFKDYPSKKKSGPCFKGTRVALLREMADCVTGSSESRMYVLSGLAGTGKSTVAYTIASRAAELNLLLCVYSETFSKAIGGVLETASKSVAIMQNPQLQLKFLILDPLRSIVQSRSRPILIVINALDECDEDDASSVLNGLCKLIQELPSFKVILTTRPQPYLDCFWRSQDGHKYFYLQDMGDKVIDGDIRLYLDHSLSMKQVQKCYPTLQWCASDEEIDSLVRTAGRFFVIASTAVRYILNKRTSNPAAQMKKLLRRLRAFAQDHNTPFQDLDHFYTIILRNVVPEDCDDNDIISRYQSIVGTIVLVQHPLPVPTLAHLLGMDAKEIRAMLDKLQSVISIGDDDVPRIYHRSFLEYVTDQARCKDPHLRIDPRIRHTQIVTRCFEIMCEHLKYNILGLGNPARFMSNEDGLKEHGITDEQLEEKIPLLLRYACIYWTNHLEVANTEDAGVVNGLEKVLAKHMLHWFEVLSLVGKLESAYFAIRVVLKLLKSSSDLHQLLSDALRFIAKSYEIIKRSALHTYYSALPFTPTDSLLYWVYIKAAEHNICVIEGPEKWDDLVAGLSHENVHDIKFSLDNTLLVSYPHPYHIPEEGKVKIWDAVTGAPISTVAGHTFAVANDFSTVVSFQDNIAMLYNVDGSPSGTMFTTTGSSRIRRLALSSESSRVAAALADGTLWLWESRNAELIHCFDGFGDSDGWPHLQFSSTGTRLIYWWWNPKGSIVNLWDAISGKFIADLPRGARTIKFSGDGSRFACLSSGLALWDSESGRLIREVRDIDNQHNLAISANGSLLATAGVYRVTLWSDSLAQIKVVEPGSPRSVAFSLDNILAIGTESGIKLYNVKTHSFMHTLPFDRGYPFYPVALAFSPDCTRLAVADGNRHVNLWDIRGIGSLKLTRVTALALSPDCSRLACAFLDGTIELWGTSPTKQRIASHRAHQKSVRVLGFGPDGGLFASGSDDGNIKLWNGGDGELHGTLSAPPGLGAVALSNRMLVAAGVCDVTLWNLDTLSLIHNFTEYSYGIHTVTIAENNALVAVAHHDGVTLLDAENHGTITTFGVSGEVHAMTFLPGNEQLVAQCKDSVFLSFNLINKHVMKEAATLEHLIQLRNISLWHGVQIWHCLDNEQHYFTASFSQDKSPVPVLWIPRHIHVTARTHGSSMIALGCWDGRVILLRLPTSHIG